MAIVAFDSAAFKARYPEFAAVSNDLLGACFNEAGIYLDNTDNSPLGVAKRAVYLNMLTAHIACLGGALSAEGKAFPVGRISSAGEGSVSASMEYQAPGSAAWFAQTQYGAAFWQATSSLRGFRYIAHPTAY